MDTLSKDLSYNLTSSGNNSLENLSFDSTKAILLVVIANFFILTRGASNRLVDLIDKPQEAIWCVPHEMAPFLIRQALDFFCGSSLASISLIVLYLLAGIIAVLAIIKEQFHIRQLCLCFCLCFYLVTSGVASHDHPYGLFWFPPIKHLFIFISIFCILFKRLSNFILPLSIALIALLYAPSRFTESWALGTFLTSGTWCGFCRFPNLVPAITSFAVVFSILAPVFFLSPSRFVRLSSVTFWVFSESFVLDLGIGRRPAVIDYSSLLLLLWMIFYEDNREQKSFPKLSLSLWTVVMLLFGYSSLIFSVFPGLHVNWLLPSIQRPDINFQCIVNARSVSPELLPNKDSRIPRFHYEEYGTYAACQPFAHFSRLTNFCEQFPKSAFFNLSIEVSRNGGPFCKELDTTFQCSDVKELLNKRLESKQGCNHSSFRYPLQNRLFKQKKDYYLRGRLNVSGSWE